MLIAFHKPLGVISQFRSDGSKCQSLSAFGFPRGVYPIGRLDADSEGLLLLSDESNLNSRLLDPVQGHPRRYWVEVERTPNASALRRLEKGLVIQGRRTLPSRAWILEPQPAVPPRDPPIRFRKNVPTSWLAIELTEGKNRQVRRMTAAVGHPTLRLIRVSIGEFELDDLAPGSWKMLTPEERRAILARR